MAVKGLDALSDQLNMYPIELINTNKSDPVTVSTEVRPIRRQPLRAVNDPVRSINLPARPAREVYQQMAAAFIGLARLMEELDALEKEEE